MAKRTAPNPIVLAMANPDPEILPEDVFAVREDALVATGCSDYPIARPILVGDSQRITIAGQEMHYPEALRPCLETVGVDPGANYIAGLYMMVLEQDLLFFADTTVNIEPDTEILAEVAMLAAIGPVLLGMARPVHVLQRGCDVSDIVNLTAIAVVAAQKRLA